MRLHNLEVTFHRTVRVAEGRAASNLPPSLGRIKMYKVSDYRKNCPEDWADDACFMSLHDTEAMWLSFQSHASPCAVLVGAGGVNALTGQKLGTKLIKDGYLVCPPQPWLDGWKDVDGTVHQFVATPHKKGDGITVAEQIIGKDSQTGAMGLAIFYPKEGVELKERGFPTQGHSFDAYDDVSSMNWSGGLHTNSMMAFDSPISYSLTSGGGIGGSSLRSAKPHVEMGLGKGGKIIQKVYEDPHGLEVWQEKPTVVFAFYLVDAKTAEEITGEKVAKPVAHTDYQGAWFGLYDAKHSDVIGTSIFSGLKSAAFTGDTSNVETEAADAGEPVPASTKKGA